MNPIYLPKPNTTVTLGVGITFASGLRLWQWLGHQICNHQSRWYESWVCIPMQQSWAIYSYNPVWAFLVTRGSTLFRRMPVPFRCQLYGQLRLSWNGATVTSEQIKAIVVQPPQTGSRYVRTLCMWPYGQ